jgi:hypothetical protein
VCRFIVLVTSTDTALVELTVSSIVWGAADSELYERGVSGSDQHIEGAHTQGRTSELSRCNTGSKYALLMAAAADMTHETRAMPAAPMDGQRDL